MDLDACGVQRDGFDPDTHDLRTLQLLEHAIQDASFGPAIHARVNRVPVAEAFGQSAPLATMFGHIKDRIDHLQIAQADVATLPGQAVFNGSELFGRDLHVGDFLAQSSPSPLVLTRPSLDQGSEHPLADAIVSAARAKSMPLSKPTDFDSGSGIGVRGTVEGKRLALGNTALMEQEGVSVAALQADGERLRGEGASIMHLAVDGHFAGILAVTDPIKVSTHEAIQTLHDSGLRIIMATGDGLTTARAVGARLRIDEVHGEVKPADKLALVEKLQKQGHVVAMAGDGINDAPALAKADVGVAMGTGTDVAMNSGQITLIKGYLRGIAASRQISIDTVRNMRQNLLFAFVYNGIGVPIAASVRYPFTGWLLSPMIAALAMSLSSASVIFKATLIKYRHWSNFGQPRPVWTQRRLGLAAQRALYRPLSPFLAPTGAPVPSAFGGRGRCWPVPGQ